LLQPTPLLLTMMTMMMMLLSMQGQTRRLG